MTTGRPTKYVSSEWHRSEVIDIFNDNLQCQSLIDPPYDLQGSIGGLIMGNIPLVCGGRHWEWKDDEIEDGNCLFRNSESESSIFILILCTLLIS